MKRPPRAVPVPNFLYPLIYLQQPFNTIKFLCEYNMSHRFAYYIIPLKVVSSGSLCSNIPFLRAVPFSYRNTCSFCDMPYSIHGIIQIRVRFHNKSLVVSPASSTGVIRTLNRRNISAVLYH